MNLPWQLHWPTVVEATLLPLVVGYALAASHWFLRRARRLAPLRAAAREELVGALVGTDDAAALRALSRLPGQERFEVLVPLALSLAGEERERLRGLAEQLGLLARARTMLRHRRWQRRLIGARTLSLLGSEEGPMERLLEDPEPLVVAEAAAWVALFPTPERVRRLVGLLREPHRVGPFPLKDALQRLGQAPEAALLEATADLPEEQLLEVLHLACVSVYPTFREPALEWLQAEAPAVRARACDLLGELGGEGAAEALLSVLDDPHADPRARAALALGKLGYAQAGAALARLARDETSWEGRWAAALGLRLMGPEGLLYLHQLEPPDLGRLVLAAPDSQIRRWARA